MSLLHLRHWTMVRSTHLLILIINLTIYLTGKTFNWARNADVAGSIDCIRYYAGWADKVTGQVQEV